MIKLSKFDSDREYLIQLLYSICDYARMGYELSLCNDCNNCGIKKECEYAPKAGQLARLNCPLWKCGD